MERHRAKLNVNDAVMALVGALAVIAMVNNVTQLSLVKALVHWTTSMAMERDCAHLLDDDEDEAATDALLDLLRTSNPTELTIREKTNHTSASGGSRTSAAWAGAAIRSAAAARWSTPAHF